MIEIGQHGRYFPQVLFPNNNDLDIADLVDRKFLRHESFALATLHAHLPIPNDLAYRSKTGLDALTTDQDRWNRPPFDVGVFEVPNMLGFEGRELGTIGMRHFLELPVADALKSLAKTQHKGHVPRQQAGQRASNESFQHISNGEGYALIGKHAPKQDRKSIMQGGPKAWRRVGVRDFDMQLVGDRLQEFSRIHEELVSEGMKASALDKITCQNLYRFLFSKLLFPPLRNTDRQDPYSLKVQIEGLVRVLTTPGVWIDFSRVEWRLRLGQIIFQIPGDSVEGVSRLEADVERRWLYLQVLLSLELLVRLDATLRIGMVDTSREKIITPHEMHHFNRLRNTKVDWDLILARRFLDHVQVRSKTNTNGPSIVVQPQNNGLLSRLKNRLSISGIESPLGTLNTVLVPRRGHMQLEGLLRFARALDWPNVDKLEENLRSKFEQLSGSKASTEMFYSTPINSPLAILNVSSKSYFDSIGSSASKTSPSGNSSVRLHKADAFHLGGWLSRSWLTGLVLPGEPTSYLLMSSLLENDDEALTKLEDLVLLHGGFVLENRSFWSKACIVGRVAGCYHGGAECMGWVSSPSIKPLNEVGKPLENGWVELNVQNPPALRRRPRIEDGQKMAGDSHFLGPGERKVMATEFMMPQDRALDALLSAEARFKSLCLTSSSKRITTTENHESQLRTAIATFDITLPDATEPQSIDIPLTYDVQFVAAHPCRPPYGHAVLKMPAADKHAVGNSHERLPAHPLHITYTYELKSLSDIFATSPPKIPNPSASPDEYGGPWVIDARGSSDKDFLIRCWCAQNGRHALVARADKVCLSCCVREARALEVGIIIRIGEKG
ncbi:MAG: hypothetical protein Q9160_000348 [Pyrenula sp. 1 TL-2023]